MALTSTIYKFNLDISDVDRGVYDSTELRLACHPSETDERAVTRLLCYALEFTEGLAFGRGICEPDDPALAVTDLTGKMQVWIDIGAPSADRLHRASKQVEVVKVWTHKDPAQLRALWASSRAIYGADNIRVTVVPPDLLEALTARLQRTNTWAILRSEGRVYVTIGDETLAGDLVEDRLLP